MLVVHECWNIRDGTVRREHWGCFWLASELPWEPNPATVFPPLHIPRIPIWHIHNIYCAASTAPSTLTTTPITTMATKAALKAAKTAIDGKRWDEAIEQANAVLDKDANNYFAKLFLGRANDGLKKFDDAEKAYLDATKIKPDDAQAWLGLRGMYEALGSAKVDESTNVGLTLAKIFMNLYVLLAFLPRTRDSLTTTATMPTAVSPQSTSS